LDHKNSGTYYMRVSIVLFLGGVVFRGTCSRSMCFYGSAWNQRLYFNLCCSSMWASSTTTNL